MRGRGRTDVSKGTQFNFEGTFRPKQTERAGDSVPAQRLCSVVNSVDSWTVVSSSAFVNISITVWKVKLKKSEGCFPALKLHFTKTCSIHLVATKQKLGDFFFVQVKEIFAVINLFTVPLSNKSSFRCFGCSVQFSTQSSEKQAIGEAPNSQTNC